MRLRFDEVELVLGCVALPEDLALSLRRSTVNLDLSEEQIAALNDACIAHVQEHGLDQHGAATETGRRLEHIIDSLNTD
jgi:hypothetical protein